MGGIGCTLGRIYSFYYFIKNPQTTIALKFLTYIISATGGVSCKVNYSVVCIYVHHLSLLYKAYLNNNLNIYTQVSMKSALQEVHMVIKLPQVL